MRPAESSRTSRIGMPPVHLSSISTRPSGSSGVPQASEPRLMSTRRQSMRSSKVRRKPGSSAEQ